jgi:hypothetical protein
MRRKRTAQRLPRYTERRWSKKKLTWQYLFHVPSWARHVGADDERGCCPLKSEALGDDYDVARDRVENILLPQFDA